MFHNFHQSGAKFLVATTFPYLYQNKTNFYRVELYSVKVRDREGMGKGQARDR